MRAIRTPTRPVPAPRRARPDDTGHRPAGLAARAAWLAAAVVLLPAPAAQAMNGLEWGKLPPPARAAYVAGVVDAWAELVAVQESLGARDVAITVFRELVGCLRERLLPGHQIYALVQKNADANPGLASKEMPDIVFAALTEDCKK
jgi:hypothetical protein